MASSYAPNMILEVREYLKPITGLDNFGLGIVNSETDASYHHGWSQRDTDGTDYSWDESARDWSHKTNAARALDIGMFDQLRELSAWLVEECKKGASDTLDIREIIYSPDGITVKRWDRLGIRTSGDSSHKTHTHISWFADAENNRKVGLFQRFCEGDDMEQREKWIVANSYQVLYEQTHEHDPIQWITDLDTGKFIELPNLPLQRAKRVESKLDKVLAKLDALTVPSLSPEQVTKLAGELSAFLKEGILGPLADAAQEQANVLGAAADSVTASED